MANFPEVPLYSNGDRLDADTMNAPIVRLGMRTAWLKERLDSVAGNRGLASVRLPDAEFVADSFGNLPQDNDFVCLDRSDNVFRKALAKVVVESNPYGISDALSYAVGIVSGSGSSGSSAKGDIVLYGLVEFGGVESDEAERRGIIDGMLEAGEVFRNGPYYLSSKEPGKITSDPKGPAIYLGTFFHGEHATYALLAPQVKDLAEMHRHRSFALAPVAQGNVSISDSGQVRILGFEPVDETSPRLFVSGTASGPRKFRYALRPVRQTGPSSYADLESGTGNDLYVEWTDGDGRVGYSKVDFSAGTNEVGIVMRGIAAKEPGVLHCASSGGDVFEVSGSAGLSSDDMIPCPEGENRVFAIAERNGRLAVVADGGVYELAPGEENWAKIGDGLPDAEVPAFGLIPTIRYGMDDVLFYHAYGSAYVYKHDPESDGWEIAFSASGSDVVRLCSSFGVAVVDGADCFFLGLSNGTVHAVSLNGDEIESDETVFSQSWPDGVESVVDLIAFAEDGETPVLFVATCAGPGKPGHVFRASATDWESWIAIDDGKFPAAPRGEGEEAVRSHLSYIRLCMVPDSAEPEVVETFSLYAADVSAGTIWRWDMVESTVEASDEDEADTDEETTVISGSWAPIGVSGVFSIGVDGFVGHMLGVPAKSTCVWNISSESVRGWTPSDVPWFAYKYEIGLDPDLNKNFPPTPTAGSSLSVNGIEKAPHELYGEASDYRITNTRLYWRSSSVSNLPFTTEGNRVFSEVLHLSRGKLPSSSFVTSLKASEGSGIRVRSEGTADSANTGNLVIDAEIPVVKTNPGMSGYEVPKDVVGNKLLFGPVVSSISSIDPSIIVISRKGQPKGRGDVLLSTTGILSGQFDDIVLRNAKQELINEFPYIKLLGSGDVASGFTMKTHVPFFLNGELDYKLLFYVSMFGLSDIDDVPETPEQAKTASLDIGVSILRDWYPGMRSSEASSEYLRTLKDNLDVFHENHEVQIGGSSLVSYISGSSVVSHVYKAFDPILVHNNGDLWSSNKSGAKNKNWKQSWIQISIPASGGKLKPNSTIAISISRTLIAEGSSPIRNYSGELGFINPSWSLVPV